MNSIKILIIATSHDKLGNRDDKTGLWLEELATPYYIFKDAGAEITIASPQGGRVPLDPKSQSIIVATPSTKRFLKDEEAMNFLSHSLLLEEIKAVDFDAAFLPGGHGPMWDIAGNKIVKQLLEDFNSENKAIGSVCHGAVGLLLLQNDKGELLIKGRQLTAFTNREEESAGLTGVVPFLLETELLSSGALYSKAASYTSYMVIDGNIITGQNAASSEVVAKKIVAYMKNSKPIQKPQLITGE
ncbi:MAG TPA: type 1 glutamine amidotransferase domain-containing protein [Chitinophagaceae bacterium]|nr:type 1 glutamine amidotransferase domain-containing protein [Chitinophagaceae bacterium]